MVEPKPIAQQLAPAEGESLSQAQILARGVSRALAERGLATLTEFTLLTGRRVDIIGLDRSGAVTIVEIKTSLEDFRRDQKWPEYLAFCDSFYFAVPEGFPREVLPEDCGLMAADPYGAAVLRESAAYALNGARRRSQNLRFALVAAERLSRLLDPHHPAGY